MFGFDRGSRVSRFAWAGIVVASALALSGCGGQAPPAESSAGSSPAPADGGQATLSLPPGGTAAGTAPPLDAKAACQAFNAGFVEYRDGLKTAANTNWLLLGAKMIDQGGRSPAEVAGPLNALSDLAYARADAGGESAPSDKEKAVTDAVLKAMGACTAAGVTLEL
ncbi:MAG: hypothetical protein L0G87_13275 [Renibacterium salmoninarum]|nr:hypothetical protein [Renibacterium salmoninarum]